MLALAPFTVFASLITLVILCFPPGYLAVSLLLNRKTIRIPFPVLIPLYLSAGLAIIMAVTYFVGTVFISPLVIIIPTVIAIIGIGVWKRKLNENISLLKTVIEDKAGTVFAAAVLVTIFAYFAAIPATTLWPPNGDAITHSTMTSLTLYQGHLPKDLNPIISLPVTYPVGFHVLSADFSLLADIYPSESIFIVATFFIIVVSSLLFTLSYSLTKSYWLSISIPFIIVIAHSTGNLESYVAGYLVNGPFPNIFGFGALLTVITLCQIAYQNGNTPFRVLPLILVLFISLFIVYPVFLTHAVLFFGTYVIVHHLVMRRTVSPIEDGGSVHSTNGEQTHYLGRRRFVLTNAGTSILIVLTFLVGSYFGGLFPLYEQMITSNTAYFSQNEESFGISSVYDAFASDIRFTGLIGITIAGVIIYMVSYLKPSPIFIGFLLLTGITISGIVLISPQRTLTFLVLMSFPLIAYLVSEGSKTRIIKSHRLLPVATTAIFVLILNILIVPNAIDFIVKNPGWFSSAAPYFDADYKTSEWLVKNVQDDELILSDRTYSSLFLYGFKVFNLSHNYWGGLFYPMPHELSSVWSDPGDVDNARQLVNKYDVKYIVLMNDPVFIDYAGWGGTGQYMGKPYSTEQYKSFFDSYGFLKLEYRNGNALVYSVQLADSS